ncbi:MAG: hypothetical protein V1789_11695 [PVC group bacterium]
MIFFIRIAKLLLGLFLIPACVSATVVFGREIFPSLKTEIWFFAGLFSYLLLLAVFQQPIRTYIFGHELTHVLWVWLFGGRVKGFRAAATGGEVRTSKSNFLIFLAPYFFPLYSALAIAGYGLLTVFFQLPPVAMRILSYLLGFTWAFHFTLTLYVLIQGQPDVWAAGRIFSFPFIYLVNVVVLASLIIFVTPRLSSGTYFSRLWEKACLDYRYLWTAGPGICEENYRACRDKVAALVAGR